ncbi:MAG: bifunctional metallophosphatase/5'-nucleotidase [Halopseudomonas aestusnigri]
MRYIPFSILLICGILLGTLFGTTSVQADYSLTVLHVNDLHSRILPIDKHNNPCSEEDLLLRKCYGGYARLGKALLDRRAALSLKGQDTILLHAGDDFEGSIFYAQYRGLASVQLLNRIGFDAMALGNHEFDGGPGSLRRFLSKSEFPVLSANTNVNKKSILAGKIRSHVIMDKSGQSIAIIGVITEETGKLSNAGENVHFSKPADSLKELIKELEADGIDKIILLSHLGYEQDREIAAKISGIDLIVGGHSKTLLSNSDNKAEGPYPVVVNNPNNQPVPIVQSYGYGKYYGEITLNFDDNGNLKNFLGDSVLLDQNFGEDTEIKHQISILNNQLEELRQVTVGATTTPLNGSRTDCRTQECTMGNMIADAILWRFKKRGVEVVIQNGGGLRASIDTGPISWEKVLTVLPFRNRITLLKINGADIISALENGFSRVEDQAGRFPQVAGMRVKWSRQAPVGKRVLSVEVGSPETGYIPLDLQQNYMLATNDYLATGGDGYDVFKTQSQGSQHIGPRLEDAVVEYLIEFSPLTVTIEGRIQAE